MAETPGSTGSGSTSPYEVHSQARGPHWIAWISRGGAKPHRSIVLVGKTKEEAEFRARQWADTQE